MDYANYIAHCIEIARRGEYYVAPNPMVGAVLTDAEGRILAEGWHERYGEGHAEVNCFKKADEALSQVRPTSAFSYRDCTLFVSLEPCSHYGKTPPCAKLIIEKGVGRVVVGMLDPNPLVAGRGVQMLRDAGIEVVVGVLEEQCRELNKRFLCLHERKRPYVVLKWAQTADGYLDRMRELPALGSELPVKQALTISTPATKQLVHRMRAENMAILVGTRTVLLDNPRLLNTHWEGRHPIRITMDRHGLIPPTARILSDEAETIVYRERTDWPYILRDLAGRGIHSVMVEGGAAVLRSILESGLWDEAHIEVAPELTLQEPGVSAPDLLQQAKEHPGTIRITQETVDGHCLYTLQK